MANIKNFIKLERTSYKNIPIYYIRYVTIKDSKYVKIYGVKFFIPYFQQSEWIP